jgi:hypothetical protein
MDFHGPFTKPLKLRYSMGQYTPAGRAIFIREPKKSICQVSQTQKGSANCCYSSKVVPQQSSSGEMKWTSTRVVERVLRCLKVDPPEKQQHPSSCTKGATGFRVEFTVFSMHHLGTSNIGHNPKC